MPYISTEKVREIRNELKRTFPQFKFSVRRQHYSSVYVSVLSGPIDFGGRTNVNHFWIVEHWKDNPTAMKFLLKVKEVLQQGQGPGYEDSDYGHIPSWYIDISIGKWDKPYVLKR